jgi:hypothetical protein
MVALHVTEREFQKAVIDLARTAGWLVAHFRPAQAQSGRWLTAMQGDVGFPDLVASRGNRVLFAELKGQKGKLASDQATWVESLRQNPGIEVYVWRPSDWDDIAARLTG